jgi:DNA-binding NtrC family response regulator
MVVLVDVNQESRAALEQTLAAQGYTVQSVASLDDILRLNGGSLHVPVLLVGSPAAPSRPLRMREIERMAIEAALQANRGNRTHAARQLGISLRKLQYRLKEYSREAETEPRRYGVQNSSRKAS